MKSLLNRKIHITLLSALQIYLKPATWAPGYTKLWLKALGLLNVAVCLLSMLLSIDNYFIF